MAEIHDHDHDIFHEHEGNSTGFVVGIVLLIVALFLFIYYLSPAIRGSGMQVNIPGRIDVNLHQQK